MKIYQLKREPSPFASLTKKQPLGKPAKLSISFSKLLLVITLQMQRQDITRLIENS